MIQGGVIKKYGYTRKAIKNAINTDGCIYRNWKKSNLNTFFIKQFIKI